MPCNRSNDFDLGTAGGLLNVDDVWCNIGSLSVENDLGMGGTEGASGTGVLLSKELSGRIEFLRMKLFVRGTLFTWPFAVPLGGCFESVADLEGGLLLCLESVDVSVSRRNRPLFWDGDGEREDIHDLLRAKFESEPETDRVLRSRSGVCPFFRGVVGSYARSSEDWPAPTTNLDMVILGSFSDAVDFWRLSEPNLLNDLRCFTLPSDPSFVEFCRTALP